MEEEKKTEDEKEEPEGDFEERLNSALKQWKNKSVISKGMFNTRRELIKRINNKIKHHKELYNEFGNKIHEEFIAFLEEIVMELENLEEKHGTTETISITSFDGLISLSKKGIKENEKKEEEIINLKVINNQILRDNKSFNPRVGSKKREMFVREAEVHTNRFVNEITMISNSYLESLKLSGERQYKDFDPKIEIIYGKTIEKDDKKMDDVEEEKFFNKFMATWDEGKGKRPNAIIGGLIKNNKKFTLEIKSAQKRANEEIKKLLENSQIDIENE